MLFLLLATACAQSSSADFGWNEPLWQRDYSTAFHGGPEALEDYSGDGIPEILISNGLKHGSLAILDGTDGSTWFTFDLPGGDLKSYWWYRKDLDGDGLPEFILVNPLSSPGYGQIAVVHGGDGQLLWEAWGREPNDEFGRYLSFVDADGDGLQDLIVGSRLNGKLAALSGKTGALLWRIYGQGQGFTSVSPDLDGDGIEDFILGGHFRLTALSGRTGAVIWNVPTQLIEGTRYWQAHYADLNLDGTSDLLLVNPYQEFGAGVVEVRDGATGATLWAMIGPYSGMQIGADALLEDRNGDGIDDLLSQSIGHPSLLDGSDGSVIWQYQPARMTYAYDSVSQQDFNGDGFSDLLIPTHKLVNLPADQIECIDGVNGNLLWSASAQWPGEDLTNLRFADFDQDGTTDVLIVSSESDAGLPESGSLRLLSGATGAELWRLVGNAPYAELGEALILQEIDSVPGLDLLLCSLNPIYQRQRFAVNGQSGQTIWTAPYDVTSLRYDSWSSADLNGDGLKDVLEYQTYSHVKSRFIGFDGQNGSKLLSLDFEFEIYQVPSLLTTLSDFSGDAIDELVIMIPGQQESYFLETYSGADGGWTSGLNLSADQISVANGGVVQAEVHFPPTQAGWKYQLLLSEAGNQSSNINGLDVPLSQGFWLSNTYMGNYPSGLLTAPTGALDPFASANITLDALPNQIAPAFAGTTMYLAVISAEPGSPWSFSSGSAAIQILP
jgi:VCBS repeat protein